MTIVIDASACIAALIDSGEQGMWAEELILKSSVVAPNLLQIESTNVLRRLASGGKINQREALAAQQDLMLLNIEVYPFEPFADRVWALRHNLSSYDAFYVALAEALDAPLATLDNRLANAPGTKCEFLSF